MDKMENWGKNTPKKGRAAEIKKSKSINQGKKKAKQKRLTSEYIKSFFLNSLILSIELN